MTSEQINFRCPVSLKKTIEQVAKRLNLTQAKLMIRLIEQGLEALQTGSLALASHTRSNLSQPVPDVQDSQIAALEKRLINDIQVIFDRLDSVEESYLADRLAINQRIRTLEESVTSLARQQELANSYPYHQPELDLHLAKIDSYVSSYAALQARVDELSDNFAQLFMEVEKVKKAMAHSASSSTPVQEASASQESLPLSLQSNEPVSIDEQSLTNPASSPTEPSPDSSNSAESWLTLGEAYKIAKANGYQASKDCFRMFPTYQEDYDQTYAQYGLIADLSRRNPQKKFSKYFRRLSQFQSNN